MHALLPIKPNQEFNHVRWHGYRRCNLVQFLYFSFQLVCPERIVEEFHTNPQSGTTVCIRDIGYARPFSHMFMGCATSTTSTATTTAATTTTAAAAATTIVRIMRRMLQSWAKKHDRCSSTQQHRVVAPSHSHHFRTEIAKSKPTIAFRIRLIDVGDVGC